MATDTANNQHRRIDDRLPGQSLRWDDAQGGDNEEPLDPQLQRIVDAFMPEADGDPDPELRAGGPKRLIAFDYFKRGYLAGEQPSTASSARQGGNTSEESDGAASIPPSTAPAPQQSESIDKDRQFHRLLADFGAARFGDVQTARERLIAYIDSHAKAAQAAPLLSELSVDLLDDLWQGMRTYHGGEPFKMGHLEFARAIEREVKAAQAAPSAPTDAIALLQRMLDNDFGKSGWPTVWEVEQCIAASKAAPSAKAEPVGELTDAAIDEVWEAMPGGAEGWLKQFGYRQFARSIARHVLVRVAASMAGTIRPTDDELWEQTIGERDNHHEWADKLANAIATYFGAEIGEHSNMNCPWAEALEVIEGAAPAPAVQAEAVAWMNPETLDVIHDTRKRAWENDFGMGGKAKAAGYTCPLAAPAVQAEDVHNQALDGLLTRIDEAHENYERFGEVCVFEGEPMIHASTLVEIAALRESLRTPSTSQTSEQQGGAK